MRLEVAEPPRAARTDRHDSVAKGLLVTLVAVGLVAAVALAVPMALRMLRPHDDTGGRIAHSKAEMAIFKNMLETYHMDNGCFPTTEQKLDALVTMPTVEPLPGKWRKLLNGDEVPRDPWGQPFVYESDGLSYDLSCLGADGVTDTEDDIRP
jgi:general secretion pathway protein G